MAAISGGRSSSTIVLDAAATASADRPDIRIDAVRERGRRGDASRASAGATARQRRISAAGSRGGDDPAPLPKPTRLLLHLGDDPLFAITIPSKTQFYLAMGRPIVAAVNGEAADILRNSGAAIVVPPRDPEALANAILELADADPQRSRAKLGRNGAEYYRRNLSFSHSKDRTIALLEGTYDKVRAGFRNR